MRAAGGQSAKSLQQYGATANLTVVVQVIRLVVVL